MSNIEPTPFGDKYLLVEHIATGGMAEVYRAQYTGIEGFAKELVVKRLREEFVERPEIVQMFLDEARVAATLTHNNVVHTYDLGELYGEYFIAMELLVGEELVAVLRRAVTTGHMIPMDLAIGIIMQALEGLHYAHAQTDQNGQPLGLVHRDINPTNIHVGYDGLCKIVDFGIAATRATAVSKGPGQFAGKLSYMAPEQIHGENLDGRADIFAVGVILYEMCVGRRLFRGKPAEVRERILSGDVPAPTFVDPEFPPELEAIIMRALEIDSNDRYQNCDHMYRELDTFMQEYGLAATPRRISAFMNEMFGEGAPAEVNYDDQYDDLEDEALDFDQFDQLDHADAGDEQPDWAKSLDLQGSSSSDDAGTPKRRRSMTIGNLEELVATMKKEEPDDAGGRTPEPAGPAASASAPARSAAARPAADRSAAPAATQGATKSPRASRSGSSRAPRAGSPGSSSRAVIRQATTRHTLSTSALEAGVTGSFGQGVVSEQTKRGNPLVWIAVIVIFAALAYFGYTILTAK
ncbi:Serine/threonine protein kinase PrkC, regulator of stationary phase [Enhygromyxa salina]|uniref:Serine/threonine protein kinase PrkC, regulator of stationary phase n=1 Tax=Enhygromyxa salina TaxID=215803 RepID=A0A0C2CX60_9BACT|nr:serine/threonine-protein kinase [Enhygromyxa salina]KIG12442.1 Serine/threonine protein kinase PrkC, regulator of stationary phase [Enhygromyxa salina]